MKTAVVILNWNGRSMLERFMPSVVEHSADADIVVADNGSTDDSVAFLQSNYPQVRLILFDKNYGFAGGYNKALDCLNVKMSDCLSADAGVEGMEGGGVDVVVAHMVEQVDKGLVLLAVDGGELYGDIGDPLQCLAGEKVRAANEQLSHLTAAKKASAGWAYSSRTVRDC